MQTDENLQAVEDEPEEKGIIFPVAEAAVALVVLAIGLTVLIGSRKLGSGWTSDGPGPGYFPFYIGIILCISAAGILYQALLARPRKTGIFVTVGQLKQVMTVLVPAAVYVLAVQFLGLYVSSAIYIAGFMVFLGHYSWPKSVGVGLGIAVVFFLMFEVWFKVPLFKGMLQPLSFLGY